MSTSPGPAEATRIHPLAAFFRARLGGEARKVPLDAGFSCPNRDGTISRAGCIFCNPAGSGTGLRAQGLDLAGQWGHLAPRLLARHPHARLLAYLQSYSNTHASIGRLRTVLAEISGLPGVAGLCLGTRPDCLDMEGDCARLDVLAQAGFGFVQLDLGLQSADDAVLRRMNRGHDAACFAAAARAAAERGLFVCAHLVHGLPGASRDDLARSVDFLNALPVAGVKFHNLLVCRGEGLETLWRAGGYAPPSREEYAAAVVLALSRLRPDICVQRLAADPAPGELLAPDWGADKSGTLRRIREEMLRQDVWQGKVGHCPGALPDWGETQGVLMNGKMTMQAERVELVAAPPLSLAIHWRGGRVARLELGRAEVGSLPPDASPEAKAVHKALSLLAEGKPAKFPALPLAWDTLPPFTGDILRALHERVPCGRTLTYGELAALAGHPGKARAVGQAMARNPWPLVVPCHRVLGADGALTGYTNPHGLDLKALLLALEAGRPAKG